MNESSPISTTDTEDQTEIGRIKSGIGANSHPAGYPFLLTVVQGSDIDFGKIYTFSSETISIGRARSNTLPLNDRKASKRHCEISVVKTNDLEQLVIRDLESTNGTYVNGDPIEQRILESGDKVTVGETVLRFNYKDQIEEEYHSRLFHFVAVDSLTGLYNRRYILNELDNQFKIARRNNRIFCAAIIDIDNFKRINDTHGHTAGDEFIKHVAFCINHTLREQDLCGRLGGEEFLILLPETDGDGGEQLANRIREKIRDTGIVFRDIEIKTTVSAGVSPYTRPIENARELFDLADKALYEAKKQGKNIVIKKVKNPLSE
ncbi:MAG: diguanylate cyclase [Candidatus Omnitrophota bacterium]